MISYYFEIVKLFCFTIFPQNVAQELFTIHSSEVFSTGFPLVLDECRCLIVKFILLSTRNGDKFVDYDVGKVNSNTTPFALFLSS